MSPYWVELQLEGYSRVVEAQILKTDDFSGAIGPDLLLNKRITVDVVENELVEIDEIPEPTPFDRIRGLIRRPERQWPSSEYVWNLPWTNLKVRDSAGEWQPLTANVDTGNSQQLSLPTSYVERFGLRLPGKCQVRTSDGPSDASCGDVEVVWQGSERTVRCIQWQKLDRPIIGMKLLSGKRITIDLDQCAPMVNIAPMPRLASSNRNFLQSFAERLRHRFAGRSRWRG